MALCGFEDHVGLVLSNVVSYFVANMIFCTFFVSLDHDSCSGPNLAGFCRSRTPPLFFGEQGGRWWCVGTDCWKPEFMAFISAGFVRFFAFSAPSRRNSYGVLAVSAILDECFANF